eukprot:1557281-Pleurochrysis_carterae.AAC.1
MRDDKACWCIWPRGTHTCQHDNAKRAQHGPHSAVQQMRPGTDKEPLRNLCAGLTATCRRLDNSNSLAWLWTFLSVSEPIALIRVLESSDSSCDVRFCPERASCRSDPSPPSPLPSSPSPPRRTAMYMAAVGATAYAPFHGSV